jgi:CRISPR-associated endonuclease/helicase Cas3
VTTATPGGQVQYSKPEWTVTKTVSVRADEIPEQTILYELINRAEAGQHVLWIRNTVIEAQQSFASLRGEISDGDIKLGLLHSRFPFERRQGLEEDWLTRLGKSRIPHGPGSILIATQVVEQSVDIDLDFIVSDLAPTDMLVQRMGRLWRHDRPTSARMAIKPEFWIRIPDLKSDANASELKSALGRSGKVYAPYVLLRSAAVWRRREEVCLPADIRLLLEATYAEPDEHEPDAWVELREELEAETKERVRKAEASMRVFGIPMLSTDDAQALTRIKGPPTVPLVLLHSIEQLPGNQWKLMAPDEKHTACTVSDFDWSIQTARFLHHWLVRVPKWQVPADAPRPRWLTEHVSPDAVVARIGEDGRLIFGEEPATASYHPDFGVFADKPAKSRPQPKPEPWSDDDDEFDQ